MLVTGTGASGDEAYAIGKGAFDAYGAPVCRVNFPNHTTADVQVSVQYLVHGLRAMSARAGRPVAVIGISQGGLLPRIALTYWPSLRKKVSDVVAAAGTQHGTTAGSLAACRREGCTPAVSSSTRARAS
jgi:triacylglycerol esterase/lipase EstA (alpha/beta hydrolase family)